MLQRSGVIYLYKAPHPIQPQITEDIIAVPVSIPPVLPPTSPVDVNNPILRNDILERPTIPKATPVPPIDPLRPQFQSPVPATNRPVLSDMPQEHKDTKVIKPNHFRKFLGFALIVIAITGVLFLIAPQIQLETQYTLGKTQEKAELAFNPPVVLPPAVPILFNPLVTPTGEKIEPINTDFSIIIPKVGINAAIVASVDPLNAKEYGPALKKGVAHAKTSYFPNQDGAVYLFSHSTNYEWFVRDLNAIFYNVKNLEEGDYIVVFYQGKRYTYEYKSREIVAPNNTAYLLPVTGKKMLILQTCWPPGTVSQRLLLFADLVEEHGQEI